MRFWVISQTFTAEDEKFNCLYPIFNKEATYPDKELHKIVKLRHFPYDGGLEDTSGWWYVKNREGYHRNGIGWGIFTRAIGKHITDEDLWRTEPTPKPRREDFSLNREGDKQFTIAEVRHCLSENSFSRGGLFQYFWGVFADRCIWGKSRLNKLAPVTKTSKKPPRRVDSSP